MDDRRRLARLALNLVEGSERGDPHADSLLADAFQTDATAAEANAYLTGFVLQLLAHERKETMRQTVERVQRLLER